MWAPSSSRADEMEPPPAKTSMTARGRSAGAMAAAATASESMTVAARPTRGQARPERVLLRFDDEILAEIEIDSDDATIIFDAVSMPRRIGRFTAEIQDATGSYGAYQVGVERLVPNEPDSYD